jgi:hypothetical protein
MTFYPAVDFHNLAATPGPTEVPYLGTVLAAMCTAMANGLFTSTTSLSGIKPQYAELIGADLQQRGYGVSFTATPGSIVVSW